MNRQTWTDRCIRPRKMGSASRANNLTTTPTKHTGSNNFFCLGKPEISKRKTHRERSQAQNCRLPAKLLGRLISPFAADSFTVTRSPKYCKPLLGELETTFSILMHVWFSVMGIFSSTSFPPYDRRIYRQTRRFPLTLRLGAPV